MQSLNAALRIVFARLLQGLLVVVFLSVLVFGAARMTGDPRHVILPVDVSQEEYDRVGRKLGLDRPLIEQYGIYVRDVLSGDLGTSLFWKQPVSEVIVERLGATLRVGLAAALLTIALSVPLGTLSAMNRGKAIDKAVRAFSVLGQAAPSFWIALLLVQLFSIQLGLLPVAGYGPGLAKYVLPVMTLVLVQVAGVTRLLRSAVIEELDSSYALMARIKGVPRSGIVVKHVLRNASGPALSYAGVEFIRAFLTGSIIVETVFAWPGVGYLTFQSVLQRDFPVIQGTVLLFGVMYVVSAFLVDVAHTFIDPRLRTV